MTHILTLSLAQIIPQILTLALILILILHRALERTAALELQLKQLGEPNDSDEDEGTAAAQAALSSTKRFVWCNRAYQM